MEPVHVEFPKMAIENDVNRPKFDEYEVGRPDNALIDHPGTVEPYL